MTRSRRFVKVPGAAPEVKLILNNKLFALLKEGKIKAVMSWKEFPAKPDSLLVLRPGSDEQIVCRVLNMHRCFNGYRPEGYPQEEASRDRSTVFDIELKEIIDPS